MGGLGELIGAWLFADTIVTVIQVVISAATQGLSGILVSLVEIWAWGLIPFPFNQLSNIIDPFWGVIELGLFVALAYLALRDDGGLDFGGMI